MNSRRLIAAVLLAAAACHEPEARTQAIVSIEVTAELRDEVKAIAVSAGRARREPTFEDRLEKLDWPVKVVLTPIDPARAVRFQLSVDALAASGEVLAHADLEAGFERAKARFMKLDLAPSARVPEPEPPPEPEPTPEPEPELEPVPQPPSAAGAPAPPPTTSPPISPAPSFLPPHLLTSANPAESTLSMSSNGTAFVAWTQSARLFAAQHHAGATWSDPREYDGASATWTELQMLADGVGGAVLASRHLDNDAATVWTTRFDGEAWTAAVRVDDPAAGTPIEHALFGGRGEGLVVAVLGRDTRGRQLYTRYATASSNVQWTESVPWALGDAFVRDSVRFTFDPAGRALFAWHAPLGTSTTNTGVYATFVRRGGVTFEAARPDGEDVLTSRDAAVTITKSGEPIVVWYDGGAWETVGANRASATGSWDSPQYFIETTQGIRANNSKIAFAPDGGTMLVWSEIAASESSVRASLFSPGAGWSASERIEARGAGASGEIALAGDAEGNFIAAWTTTIDAQTSVWANRYLAGTGWTTAVQLDHEGVSAPQVAAGDRAHALVIWRKMSSLWSSTYE